MFAPPYSSDTVMPSTPSSPILRHRSMGNWSLRSISAARGAISACAKAVTASRSASTSSPSWWLSPGNLFMRRSPMCGSVMNAFASGDGHLGRGHGGNEFFPALVDRPGPAFDDGDRAAWLDDQAFHAKPL